MNAIVVLFFSLEQTISNNVYFVFLLFTSNSLRL
ncbi:hypothetical protein YPPY66_1367, partial [Yersinia pestis PY-66]